MILVWNGSGRDVRARIWVAAAAMAVLVGIAWRVGHSDTSDPVYEGRRLSTWLTESKSSKDIQSREEAIQAIGTNGLPLLLEMIERKDSSFKKKMKELAEGQSVIKTSFNPDGRVRQCAREGFLILQAEAKPAIPALVELLTKKDINSDVALALVDIGPDGVAALAGAVTNTDPYVRWSVAYGLCCLGIRHLDTNATAEQIAALNQETDIAVPTFLTLLKEKHGAIRGYAAQGLGFIGKQSEVVVPALITALQDTNGVDDVIAFPRAAAALGKFGPKAERGVPALEAALDYPWPGVRLAASNALKRIDPGAAEKAGIKLVALGN